MSLEEPRLALESQIYKLENVIRYLNGEQLDADDKERVVFEIRSRFESDLRKAKKALDALNEVEGQKDPLISKRAELRWARRKKEPKHVIDTLEREYEKLKAERAQE